MYCLTWEMQGGAYTLRGFDAVLEPLPVVWPKQAPGSPRSKNNFSLRNLRHIMVAPPVPPGAAPILGLRGVSTRLVARLINTYWQYCQSGDTNVDSSETSGIMKLSPSMRRPVDVKAYFAFFFP